MARHCWVGGQCYADSLGLSWVDHSADTPERLRTRGNLLIQTPNQTSSLFYVPSFPLFVLYERWLGITVQTPTDATASQTPTGEPIANTPSMQISPLDLPGKIRNKSYSSVLLREEPIRPFWATYDNRLGFNILSANRKVNKETKAIFHAHNAFDFTLYNLLELNSSNL